MKNSSPQKIAFGAAGMVTLLTAVVLLVLTFLKVSLPVHAAFAIMFVVFTGSYFIFYVALEQFIYRKIKLIYKIIYDRKSPKKGRAGKVELQSGVMKDVEQEVKQWVKSSKQELDQMRKLEEYRKEFLGNVSHELKTPIFNIQGYLETLIDGGMADEKINEDYLHKAARNVDRLITIIDDLQVIANIEDGQFVLEMRQFNIKELVQEVFDSFGMQADAVDITFGFKTGSDKAFRVVADKDRIRQVLVNLISNSIKYGKEGGETLVGFYDMDENVLVEISDNGIGIEKEHLPRLFERFYRVDKNRSRSQGGSGLGLSIVKHILEAHQQTINVRSRSGVGTTFGFTLKKG